MEPPNTVLGQLQRGQGRGYLAAREAMDVEALLHCIHNDPRWDRQVEHHSMYYARLARELNVDVAAIAWHFDAEDDRSLTADVLAELGERGVVEAFDALRHALRSPNWRAAADSLNWAQMDREEPLVDTADLAALMEHEGLADIVWRTREWRMWAELEPRLTPMLLRLARPSDLKARRELAPKPDTSMSTEALLSIVCVRNMNRVANVLTQRRDPVSIAAIKVAGESGTPAQINTALQIFRHQGNASLVESCFERAQREPGPIERREITMYLSEVLGESTRTLARRFIGDTGFPGVVAARVLAKHAQAEDREPVEAEIRSLVDRGEPRGICDWAEVLGVIGSEESSALLETNYHTIVYSYARGQIIRALHACDPATAIRLAPDALYDSEHSTRLWATQNAPRTPHTAARFAEMAEDEFESKNIRAAAAKRVSQDLYVPGLLAKK